MPLDDSTQLQGLIDRLQQGDRQAKELLLERAYERMRRLAQRILAGSFPAVQARHDVHSVVHETWLRLLQTLDKSQPPTVADFFRLAAFKIRQVLLDLAERERRRGGREALGLPASAAEDNAPGQYTHEPGRIAVWTDFHERVASLPPDERAVFEMHYYLELPQTEIARVLELHPRKVSYLWVAATEKLADVLGADDELS
jgi:RNA polymerase sigma factor (sigma-70 family)